MVGFWVFQSIRFSTSTRNLPWKWKKYRFLSLNPNFLSYLILLIFPHIRVITPQCAERNPVTSLTFRGERATISVCRKCCLDLMQIKRAVPADRRAAIRPQQVELIVLPIPCIHTHLNLYHCHNESCQRNNYTQIFYTK